MEHNEVDPQNQEVVDGATESGVTDPVEMNVEKQKKKKKKNKKVEIVDPNYDKEREKAKMFDPRGIQTLFRTMSRNHYNLLKMVDNKSSIVLTINSIIISLTMGALYVAPEDMQGTLRHVSRSLLFFCLASMVFALFSMLPHKYTRWMTRGSDYKGTLYAANFARRPLTEFQKEFDRITKSGDAIYEEMTKDLYFLGKVINAKQITLMLSVVIFLIGLIYTGMHLAADTMGSGH